MRDKHRVWCALQAREDCGTKILIQISTNSEKLGASTYIDGTNEIFVTHQDVSHGDSKYDSQNPT